MISLSYEIFTEKDLGDDVWTIADTKQNCKYVMEQN